MIGIIGIAVTWISTGVALGVMMGRRGHMALAWGLVGVTLGPLAIVAAKAASRQETQEPPADLAVGTSGGGPVEVLVGIDGSPECLVAMERAVALLGPRLGRLTLAAVVPFDDEPEHTARAVAALDRHARLSGVPAPGEELLHGPPARALADFAGSHGYKLLAVGTRGRGLSKAVLGSTASALAAGSEVPVLIVGSGPPAASAAAGGRASHSQGPVVVG